MRNYVNDWLPSMNNALTLEPSWMDSTSADRVPNMHSLADA